MVRSATVSRSMPRGARVGHELGAVRRSKRRTPSGRTPSWRLPATGSAHGPVVDVRGATVGPQEARQVEASSSCRAQLGPTSPSTTPRARPAMPATAIFSKRFSSRGARDSAAVVPGGAVSGGAVGRGPGATPGTLRGRARRRARQVGRGGDRPWRRGSRAPRPRGGAFCHDLRDGARRARPAVLSVPRGRVRPSVPRDGCSSPSDSCWGWWSAPRSCSRCGAPTPRARRSAGLALLGQAQQDAARRGLAGRARGGGARGSAPARRGPAQRGRAASTSPGHPRAAARGAAGRGRAPRRGDPGRPPAARGRFEALSRKVFRRGRGQFLVQAEERMRRSQEQGAAELARREEAVRGLVEPPLAGALEKVRAEVAEAGPPRRAREPRGAGARGAQRVRAAARPDPAARERMRSAGAGRVGRSSSPPSSRRRACSPRGFVRRGGTRSRPERRRAAPGHGRAARGRGKQVVVDAKVAFLGYLQHAGRHQSGRARGPPGRPRPRHMRKHVDDLGAKRYWDQFGPARSSCMFGPAEPFLSAAVKQDPVAPRARGVQERHRDAHDDGRDAADDRLRVAAGRPGHERAAGPHARQGGPRAARGHGVAPGEARRAPERRGLLQPDGRLAPKTRVLVSARRFQRTCTWSTTS